MKIFAKCWFLQTLSSEFKDGLCNPFPIIILFSLITYLKFERQKESCFGSGTNYIY